MSGRGRRVALVLRPEPGNSRTADRLRRAGLDARQLPLFATAALDWTPPDPARYDALLVTSGNAVRRAGAGLDRLRTLPTVAIGEATAAAAREAGLDVRLVGSGNADEAASRARAAGLLRLLHLAAREAVVLPGIDAVPVYASEALPVAAGVLAREAGATVLLHSPRAAARFAELVGRDGLKREDWRLAAFSPAVAAVAGPGWRQVLVAPVPTDAALIAAMDMVAGTD